MPKTITADQLEQIFYKITYENGVTFGVCGNAGPKYWQRLCDTLNAHFSTEAPSEQSS